MCLFLLIKLLMNSMKQKIKGKAIAVKCKKGMGRLLKTNKVYLVTPHPNYTDQFQVYIPHINSEVTHFYKRRFEPINPLHKSDPSIF